ncbi:MAG: acyltransferase, partial [Methyloprofundus sp.]|nr:acyltransferase [Methyloprofundus sp.]
QPTAAFYLLPTRGWELAAGGLAFLIGREVVALQRYAKPLLWSGFALWGIAIVMLDSSYAWPSGWALLPVLGTVLIILANQSQAKLTVNPIAQWLGDRSYSLYLWHWPLVVALYFAGLQNDWLWVSGAIVLSLILAHLSYHLVEVPTRSYLSASSLRKEIFAIALTGLVIGLAAVSVANFDYKGRFEQKINNVSFEGFNRNWDAYSCRYRHFNNSIPGCVFGKNVDVVLLGDSHSEAVASALGSAGQLFSRGYLFLAGAHGCPTFIGKNPKGTGCENYNQLVYEKTKQLPSEVSVVIINTNWDGQYLEQEDEFVKKIVSTSCAYTKKNRPVYLTRPIPSMPVDVPKTLTRDLIFGRGSQDIKITLEEYHQRHKLVWEAQDQAAEQCGVKILDPLPYLCDDQYCYGSRDLRPLY